MFFAYNASLNRNILKETKFPYKLSIMPHYLPQKRVFICPFFTEQLCAIYNFSFFGGRVLFSFEMTLGMLNAYVSGARCMVSTALIPPCVLDSLQS